MKTQEILHGGGSEATEMQGRGTECCYRKWERSSSPAGLGQSTAILTRQDNKVLSSPSWDKGMRFWRWFFLSVLAPSASLGKAKNRNLWELTWCWFSGAESLTSSRSSKLAVSKGSPRIRGRADKLLPGEEQLLWTSPTTARKSGFLALDRYSLILYCFKSFIYLFLMLKNMHVFRNSNPFSIFRHIWKSVLVKAYLLF